MRIFVFLHTVRLLCLIAFNGIVLPVAGNDETRQQPLQQPESNGDNDFVVVPNEYLDACTYGGIDDVRQMLQEHPEWIHGRSTSGETCLHVAGIYGSAKITEFLLQAGADANVRSLYKQGLRMMPLAWNVYGGHLENVRLLLEMGQADVNMDFDAMGKDGSSAELVTCLDIVMGIIQNYDEQPDSKEDRYENYVAIKELLLQHGAKPYSELQKSEPDL